MDYRRDIDGLRAIAVLSVVLYHAQLNILPGGYVGVDVFFVISGYLITGIIIRGKEAGTFSLLGFYERRARRILPALYVVVAACLPAAWLWMMPYQLKDFAASVTSVVLFVSNFFFWRSTGYFAQNAAELPLLHTWTLAIEEQFYVFFPLLVIALWRFGKNSPVYGFVGLLCLSLLLSEWGYRHAPNANFFLMPTRAWELLLGAVASCCPRDKLNRSAALNQVLSAIGLLLIVHAARFYDDNTPFPSRFALVPTVGAALVILYSTPDTIVGRLLSLPPFVGIGLISYSVYLWHYPLFAFARIVTAEPTDHALAWALVGMTLLLSVLSWRLVEQPFRNRRVVARPVVAGFAVGGLVIFLSVGVAGHQSNGLEQQFARRFGAEGAALNRAIASRGLERVFQDHACRFWGQSADAAFTDSFERCAKGRAAYLIVGDSHAMDLYNAIYQNSSYPFVVMLAKGGCRPQTPEEGCHYDQAVEFVKRHRAAVKQVFFTEAGSYFLENPNGRVAEKAVVLTERYLKRFADIIPVVWFGPQIETGVELRKVHPARKAVPPQSDDLRKAMINVDLFIKDLVRKDESIRYVSKIDAVRYEHAKDFVIDGDYTYSDVDHWSTHGERIFGERLVTYLRKAGFSDL